MHRRSPRRTGVLCPLHCFAGLEPYGSGRRKPLAKQEKAAQAKLAAVTQQHDKTFDAMFDARKKEMAEEY